MVTRLFGQYGVDLWQKEDQANNSRQETWHNVELEGVADRIELKDGDTRRLHFQDQLFDCVVSSWALHNIYSKDGREQAVSEMIRTLKPEGRLVIIDISHTREYAHVLISRRMVSVARGRPNYLFVIPSYAVTATKPG
jgi:arsenite methyltransferase